MLLRIAAILVPAADWQRRCGVWGVGCEEWEWRVVCCVEGGGEDRPGVGVCRVEVGWSGVWGVRCGEWDVGCQVWGVDCGE